MSQWKDIFSIYPLNTLMMMNHLQYRLDNCFKASICWKRDLQRQLRILLPNSTKEDIVKLLTFSFKHGQFTLLRYLIATDAIPIYGIKLNVYSGIYCVTITKKSHIVECLKEEYCIRDVTIKFKVMDNMYTAYFDMVLYFCYMLPNDDNVIKSTFPDALYRGFRLCIKDADSRKMLIVEKRNIRRS